MPNPFKKLGKNYNPSASSNSAGTVSRSSPVTVQREMALNSLGDSVRTLSTPLHHPTVPSYSYEFWKPERTEARMLDYIAQDRLLLQSARATDIPPPLLSTCNERFVVMEDGNTYAYSPQTLNMRTPRDTMERIKKWQQAAATDAPSDEEEYIEIKHPETPVAPRHRSTAEKRLHDSRPSAAADQVQAKTSRESATRTNPSYPTRSKAAGSKSRSKVFLPLAPESPVTAQNVNAAYPVAVRNYICPYCRGDPLTPCSYCKNRR